MTSETARQMVVALCKQGALTLDAFEGILSCLRRGVRPVNGESHLKRGRPPLYLDASSWNWEQGDIEIARSKAIGVGTVRKIRQRLGHSAVAAPNNPAALKSKRALWDWTKSDSELGKMHSMSRERVRQIRASLGLPSRREEATDKQSEREKAFLLWVNGRPIISQRDAEKSGFGGALIRKWCSKHGIVRKLKNRPPKRPWHLVNWDLMNIVLAEIWQTKPHNIANHRCHKGKPKAKWRYKGLIPKDVIELEASVAAAHFLAQEAIPIQEASNTQ